MTVTWQSLLGLSVVGALVTTAGTLLGLFLKEVVFSRSFERWKGKRALEDVFRKYREPIGLAALELCNRLTDICDDYPPDYLDSTVLSLDALGVASNSADDPHYRRYRLISTVYRLCAFLGWVELYRQDTTYLDPGEVGDDRRVDRAIFALRADLADGQLNDASDWQTWRDMLVFREEQRAIGESMIVANLGARSVMGYGQFSDLFEASPQTPQTKWLRAAALFVMDPQSTKDFRQVRFQRLIVHLVDLADVLTPSRVREEHCAGRTRYAGSIRGAA